MFAKYVLLLSCAAVSQRGIAAREEVRDIHSELKDIDPRTLRSTTHSRPIVGAGSASCGTTVDMIKKGPANIPAEI